MSQSSPAIRHHEHLPGPEDDFSDGDRHRYGPPLWLTVALSVGLHVLALMWLELPTHSAIDREPRELEITFMDEPAPDVAPPPTPLPQTAPAPEPPLPSAEEEAAPPQRVQLTTSDYDPNRPLLEQFRERPGEDKDPSLEDGIPKFAPRNLEFGLNPDAEVGGNASERVQVEERQQAAASQPAPQQIQQQVQSPPVQPLTVAQPAELRPVENSPPDQQTADVAPDSTQNNQMPKPTTETAQLAPSNDDNPWSMNRQQRTGELRPVSESQSREQLNASESAPQPAEASQDSSQGLGLDAFFKDRDAVNQSTSESLNDNLARLTERELQLPGRGGTFGGGTVDLPDELATKRGGTTAPGDPFTFEVMNAPGYNIYPYILKMKTRLRANWHVPTVAYTGAPGMSSFEFHIQRDGTVMNLRDHAHQGPESYQNAARMAIELSDPLPKLPGDFPESSLILRFSFLYNVRPTQ